MNFTVVWRTGAEDDLAEIWVDAKDRNAVTNAVTEIESALKSQPETTGESRGGQDRIVFVPPLAVLFEVREPDRMVCVLGVWRTG